ncbi:MAG: hypothetical protein HYU77_15985 [Betaproteobacteria bacterium]|nr:hypothetical protein [Betaproteobacteria bacterium]
MWRPACILAFAALSPAALAQAKAPQQTVKPPVAQAWLDVATYAGMAGMGGGANPMGALGGMFSGGRGEANRFGNTQTGSAGRWLDVTLRTSRNPNLAEATQTVPAGSRLAPVLKLASPQEQKAPPADDGVTEPESFERPKGKIYLYWGCGEAVRPGQPRVLDMASASAADYGRLFQARRATQRGAHQARGRPVWPNPADGRMVPEGASLVGEHAFSGQGVPEGFKFAIPSAQDIMPPLDLVQRDAGGATMVEWPALPTARAYFLAAMGSRGENELVIWSSSEVPETGTGLIDYQTNAAVDRWLNEKVLLAPGVTRCAVPKGVFGEGAMLRAIAYGSELDVAHPPRPANPKQSWEPEWAAKLRVKSVAMTMLGMDMGGASGRESAREAKPGEAAKDQGKTITPVDVLRGILGR